MTRQHSFAQIPIAVYNSTKFGQQAIILRLEPVELDGTQTYGTKTGEEIYKDILEGNEFTANAQLTFRKNERGELELVIENIQA
jgi:hypothetical protein